MTTPLVSIIIPVFNREELIKETLNSILFQTFNNWECIVVDDGSTDGTRQTVKAFVEKDSRIQLYIRPQEKLKGANSCRNFGFIQSKGYFIQWFDSDDLMFPDFLKIKVAALTSGNYDFAISKTKDFKHPDSKNIIGYNTHYYKFVDFELSHFNYVSQKLNWLTPDFLVKRSVIKNTSYNEKLPSGQEYNFLCKLTARTTNAVYINEFLALRRIHANSIKSLLQKNKIKYLSDRAIINFENWQDLKSISTPEVLDFLFTKSVDNSLNTNLQYSTKNVFRLAEEIRKRKGEYVASLYLAYQFFGKIFNRGHFLRKKFLREWRGG